MTASIDDFSRRLAHGNKKITFVFTEDFFNIDGKHGINTSKFIQLRNTIKNVGHRRGMRGAILAGGNEEAFFDVDVVIVRANNTCFSTSFKELAEGPFGYAAVIAGYGEEMVDAEKARLQIDMFYAEKKELTQTVTQMLNERKNRQIVLVAEKPADLKRPSFEPIRNLRNRLYTILISPDKGPIVDCQVNALYQEGNSNTLVSLLNHFCVKY
ncbi:MAG: hypothetical protein LBQ54_06600 [Planctomycetaceae bacterium]|jgi:hypothetical protein|nr:hypothetical protein [Planctomycetaceae bacterium]